MFYFGIQKSVKLFVMIAYFYIQALQNLFTQTSTNNSHFSSVNRRNLSLGKTLEISNIEEQEQQAQFVLNGFIRLW